MRLNEIRDNPGARHARKRIGRGTGSGLGKTAGKGHKGQKARSGPNSFVGFEGGQMPLYQRLPKRGFKNPFRKDIAIVNLGVLQRALDGGKIDGSQPIDEALLRAAGVCRKSRDGVRLLAKGTLTTAVRITVTAASKGAIAAIAATGGQITLTGPSANDDGSAPEPEPAGAPAGETDSAASA